jgi:sec-independent protein translocase protein TatA
MGLGLENPVHIAIVLVVVLLVFGAKRVPDIARSLGEGIRTFKQSVTGETQVAQIEAKKENDPSS